MRRHSRARPGANRQGRAQEGQAELAVRLYACSDALRAQALDMRPPIEQDRVDRDFAIIDSQLDRAAREAVRVKGRELTMEQAIAEVFQLRSFL